MEGQTRLASLPACDSGQFNAKALLHNLRDSDYGKTLSDIRVAFYSAPRLPLLYGGDRDLQQAIYDAATAGALDIVDGTGAIVAVTAPNQVNLASTGLRLTKPQPKTCPTCGNAAHPESCENGTRDDAGPGASSGGSNPTDEKREPANAQPTPTCAACGEAAHDGACQVAPPVSEQQVAFSFSRNLLASPQDADDLAAVFKALYMAVDERKISYLQGTLQLVLDNVTAAGIQERLSDLGITVTIKDI